MACGTSPSAVESWALAEVLTIYIEQETDRALEQWRFESVLWQIRATFFKSPGKQPELPALVKRRQER